jgi:hypothetical protein
VLGAELLAPAQSRVKPAILPTVMASGSQAMSRKNSVGSSIGLRSPTLTIHSRSAP